MQTQNQRGGDQNGLQTLVDLAVGRFAINNGAIDFAPQSEFQLSGENLQASLFTKQWVSDTADRIAMSPLHFQSGQNPRLMWLMRLPCGS